MITLIAIGKNHESWIRPGVDRYLERLQGAWKSKWILLPHSSKTGLSARQEESQAILSRLDPADYVVVLDEHGTLLDSPAFSKKIEMTFTRSRHLVFVIGGAYGVSGELLERADLVWSLSPLVFPHQLVRLLLAEQLYRAQEIAANHPYHHA